MANLVSFAGLYFALSGIILAGRHWVLSIPCLVVAGICDLFDGYIARKVNAGNRTLGRELDSLIDVVSFGVLPVAILVNLGGSLMIDALLSFVYVSCVVRRLAVFNMLAENRDYFTGIPVTYVSLLLPLALVPHFALGEETVVWIARGLMLAMAFLYVSGVRIRKPRGIAYIIYPIVGILLIILWIGFYLRECGPVPAMHTPTASEPLVSSYICDT